MATLIAHLVIAEQVSSAMTDLRSSSAHGAFLLGCLLADANHHCDLDRGATHLCRSWNRDGKPSQSGSAKFLKRLDALLLRSWSTLAEQERAFVAGYLCHLAADEAWLRVSWSLLQALGLTDWDDLPIPGEAMLVTFNELSHSVAKDYPAMASALNSSAIPKIFRHVPHEAFRRTWDIVQAYVFSGGTLESYLRLLPAQGKTTQDIQEVREGVERNGEAARALIEAAGGIESFLRAAVKWSILAMHQLAVAAPQAPRQHSRGQVPPASEA